MKLVSIYFKASEGYLRILFKDSEKVKNTKLLLNKFTTFA